LSRSYCTSWVTDRSRGRSKEKRYANHTIRKAEDVPNGKTYKKFYESWDISDYRWLETKQTMSKWCLKPWQYNRK
jgi:hypothetical protein